MLSRYTFSKSACSLLLDNFWIAVLQSNDDLKNERRVVAESTNKQSTFSKVLFSLRLAMMKQVCTCPCYTKLMKEVSRNVALYQFVRNETKNEISMFGFRCVMWEAKSNRSPLRPVSNYQKISSSRRSDSFRRSYFSKFPTIKNEPLTFSFFKRSQDELVLLVLKSLADKSSTVAWGFKNTLFDRWCHICEQEPKQTR